MSKKQFVEKITSMEENALFFEDYGAAIVINRHEDILESVTNLLQDEEKLESMKQNIKKLHLKQSSQTILEDIVEQSDLIMSNKSYAQALS